MNNKNLSNRPYRSLKFMGSISYEIATSLKSITQTLLKASNNFERMLFNNKNGTNLIKKMSVTFEI